MFRTVATASLVLLAASSLVLAGEDSIAFDKLPAAVQDAVKKVIGTAKAEDITKETEDGKTVYEVEFEVDDVDHSATIAEDGKVLEEEMEIKAADLPAAVAATIKKAVPNGKIEEAYKVTADGKTFYEADVESGDEDREVKVAADGTLVSNTVEKDEDQKGEHDEKDDDKDGGKEGHDGKDKKD